MVVGEPHTEADISRTERGNETHHPYAGGEVSRDGANGWRARANGEG